jgi:predicted glycoside hydrolase/deacetylase ChbG (UPF0249 family)
MDARLMVNADDFGLTEGTNRAIVDAHCKGIVTSTSLLANGYAFEHAVSLAREHPSLGVGVHLTLTEGPPVVENVIDQLYPGGTLPLSNQPYVRALVAGRLPRSAIRREFEAQVEKIVATGIRPTHIDGHKHVHLLPGITAIAADVARQFSIPVMRVPHRLADSPLVLARLSRLPGMVILMVMGTLAYRVAKHAGLHTSDRVVGFVDTGHLDRAAIRRLLNRPRPGVTELLCHPAYRSRELDELLEQGYRWIATFDFDSETAAVSDPTVGQALESAGWTLRDFGNAFDPGQHN